MFEAIHLVYAGFAYLNRIEGLGLLSLRLLLAYEFWLSGVEKFSGVNWFAEIQDAFPFPLSIVPPSVSWFLATWFELIGSVALVAGFATRFFSLSLMALTLVAIISVHGTYGYNVCANGWKLPMIYLVMFLPLLLQGGGSLSLDRLIARRWFERQGKR